MPYFIGKKNGWQRGYGRNVKKRKIININWKKRVLAAVTAVAMTGAWAGSHPAVFASEPELMPGDFVTVSSAVAGQDHRELPPQSGGPQISASSAVLMEASTGQVIFEKNADEPKSPASITKSSQVFLEEGEVQTVETLIKCIVIASGNDASVAMAEYIAGDEGTFVSMMNERARGLGMSGTHFEDCCGLTDSPDHVTTARDIAVMSRELINRYPQIHNYSTIWMDTITHETKQGTKEFGLSNTNKLLKMAVNFQVTGLKTGSTSLAKYCLSATAEKDGVRLIASIMAAPDYKARFADAAALLNYGYANCSLYEDATPPRLPVLAVEGGTADQAELQYGGAFSYLGFHGEDFSAVEKKLVLPEAAEAPVELGAEMGQLEYWLGKEKLGQVPILAAESVKKAGYLDVLKKIFGAWHGAVKPEKQPGTSS